VQKETVSETLISSSISSAHGVFSVPGMFCAILARRRNFAVEKLAAARPTARHSRRPEGAICSQSLWASAGFARSLLHSGGAKAVDNELIFRLKLSKHPVTSVLPFAGAAVLGRSRIHAVDRRPRHVRQAGLESELQSEVNFASGK
jgi:hypothetical protein